MSSSTQASTDLPPSAVELIERARKLHPLLSARAKETEEAGRVSEESISLVKAAGLHRLGQPRRFGGYACGPREWLRVGFELGRACGSTGWAVMVANSCSWFAAYWPLEVQEEIWGSSPDSLVCLSGVPTGKCREVEGGFEVWGAWPYASNSDNSDWAVVSAAVDAGSGAETTWFMVEMDDLAIDADSWKVSGLAGTGSKTLVRTDPLFVPERRAVRLSQITLGETPGSLIPGNELASWNFATLGGVTLTAPLLGAAQGALDCFTESMKTKVKTSVKAGASAPASLSASVQMRIGDASARIDAALALLLHDLEAYEGKVRAGEDAPVADRVRVRRDIGFAARQALDAVTLLIEGASASAMSLDAPLQRFWRDVVAGTRHVTLDIDGIYVMCGQERLGLPPAGPH